MKKILLPTDFSEHSEKVYALAATIAKANNATITLYNIVPSWSKGIINYLVYGQPAFLEDMADFKSREALRDLQKVMYSDVFEGVSVNKEVKLMNSNDLKKAFIDEINEEKFDLIIIGHAVEKRDFLSFSKTLTQKVNVPVLACTQKSEKYNPKSVLISTDFENVNAGFFKRINQLTTDENITNTIFYVNTRHDFLTTDEINKNFKILVNKYHIPNAVLKTINSEDVAGDILEESTNHDLLAIPTRGNTGLMKLLTQSITEQIVDKCEIPVYSYNLHDYLEDTAGVRTHSGFTG